MPAEPQNVRNRGGKMPTGGVEIPNIIEIPMACKDMPT